MEIQPEVKRHKFTLDLRFIVLLLLAVIAGMLVMWKPWDPTSANDQTISVTGEAKLTDTPDEFVFYPNYEYENDDKDAAIKELSAKSEEVINKLKELGVANEKIKSGSSGNDYKPYFTPDDGKTTYTLQLTVTANSAELAQKVQDYLVTTTPTGNISPQANFSEEKRKSLEEKARDQATKSARAKAEQSAKNLGFKIGKVKSVNDGSGFDIMPMDVRTLEVSDAASSSTLAVQPGENDLHYSVTVVYYIK